MALNSSSFTTANREYFNHSPKSTSSSVAQRVARITAEAMLDLYDFDDDEEEGTVMMDFACGAGLASQALAPYCKQIIGVDISEGMVEAYNNRVDNQGIPREEMRAIHTDLLGGEEGELKGVKFDVIVCAMAYHHIPDLANTTSRLYEFLKPETGTLLVVDLLREYPRIHEPSTTAGKGKGEAISSPREPSLGHALHHQHDQGNEAEGRDILSDTKDKPNDDNTHLTEPSHGETASPSSVPKPDAHAHSDAHSHSHSQSHEHSHTHSHHHVSNIHSHSHSHIVAHKGGLTEAEIRTAFSSANLQKFEWVVSKEFDTIRGGPEGRDKARVFVAKGVRA